MAVYQGTRAQDGGAPDVPLWYNLLKTMFDADRWPDAPKYEAYGDDLATYKKDLQEFLDLRSISFPFVVRPINPRNMIWDDSKTRMKWAIQFTCLLYTSPSPRD